MIVTVERSLPLTVVTVVLSATAAHTQQPVPRSRGRSRRGIVAGVALASCVLRVAAAQVPTADTARSPTTTAAAAITAADLALHLGMLAHDSLRDRATPSPGLERTARYVAARFEALGLQPAGDSGGIQHYVLPRQARVNEAGSSFVFWAKVKRGGTMVIDERGYWVTSFGQFSLADAVIIASDTVLEKGAPGAIGRGQGLLGTEGFPGPAPVVVAGPHTVESVRQARLQDKVVIYVPPFGADSAAQRPVLDLLRADNHVVIIADEDSIAWSARRRAAQAKPPVVLEQYLPEAARPRRWVVYVWAAALAGRLALAGVDLTEARAAVTPFVREANAVAHLGVAAAAVGPSAPNVVAVLPGREQGGAIVFTAHMDRLRAADSAAAGAHDNAPGVAGLLALAQAFAQTGEPPRHTLVFAAVSGAAEFWGSDALIGTRAKIGIHVALNVNLDALGGGPRDTVYLDGLQDVELPVRPAWVAAQHPELALAVADGGSVVAPTSDHFAFVRRAVPSLYVHDAASPAPAGAASPEVTATSGAADAEQLARRLRFVFAFTREIVAAERLPQWSAVGRERRAGLFGQ